MIALLYDHNGEENVERIHILHDHNIHSKKGIGGHGLPCITCENDGQMEARNKTDI